MDLTDFLNLATILISASIILVVLLQSRGGGLGDMFGGGGGGGGGSGYRTRRGVERALFQLTILIMAVFIVLSALSVRAHT